MFHQTDFWYFGFGGCQEITALADPGFEKGGRVVASEAGSQDFFGQFRGLFKEFGAKRGGCKISFQKKSSAE